MGWLEFRKVNPPPAAEVDDVLTRWFLEILLAVLIFLALDAFLLLLRDDFSWAEMEIVY